LGFVVTVGWVEQFVAPYFAKFADISHRRLASVAMARTRKHVRTKIGRLIRISDDASDRSVFNLPVQAPGADGLNWL
jgi:hypothetical protein